MDFSRILRYPENIGMGTVHFVLALVGARKPLPNRPYWLNALYSLDELGNALIGGDAGETISSRAAKAQLKGVAWGCILCKGLDFFQKGHCLKSLVREAGGDAFIPDD